MRTPFLLQGSRAHCPLQVSSGEAAAAQEYLANQEQRLWRMADVHSERAQRQRKRGTRAKFPCAWVHGQAVQVQ